MKCDYSWFPRGKNRSRKCPSCGCKDVKVRREYVVYHTKIRKVMRRVMIGAGVAGWIGLVCKVSGLVGICLSVFLIALVVHYLAKGDEVCYE